MACDHFPTRNQVAIGFGAGALISSISFELTAEGFQLGGAMPLTLGIAAGALAFFFADRGVKRLGNRIGGAAGLPLALGALLDGIPEQAVLGIGLAQGEGRVSGHPGTIRGSGGRFRRRSVAGHACRIDDSRSHDQGRRETGLAAVLGFAVAAGLSAIS